MTYLQSAEQDHNGFDSHFESWNRTDADIKTGPLFILKTEPNNNASNKNDKLQSVSFQILTKLKSNSILYNENNNVVLV